MQAVMLVPVLAATLAACGTSPRATTSSGNPPPAEAPAPSAPPAAGLATALPAHHWRLERAENADGKPLRTLFVEGQPPLQLDFGEDRLSVSQLCNRLNGGYALDNGTLQLGRMASTKMACAVPGRMTQESAATELLQGRFAVIMDHAGADPRLTLRRQDGTTLVLTGTPTAETRYRAPGEQVFLEVAAQTRICRHPPIPDKQCLQVRELRYDDNGLRQGAPGQWQDFHDVIEGYRHQDGVRNVLRVQRYPRQQLPADTSANAYVLDMVLETETVRP